MYDIGFITHDLIGIQFVDGGRDENGLDCFGLVKIVYQRMGEDIGECAVSAMDAIAITKDIKERDKGGDWMPLDVPEVGAVILFRLMTSTEVNHAGIYIGDGRFIHAYEGAGVCIDRLKKWKSRIVGYYRLRSKAHDTSRQD